MAGMLHALLVLLISHTSTSFGPGTLALEIALDSDSVKRQTCVVQFATGSSPDCSQFEEMEACGTVGQGGGEILELNHNMTLDETSLQFSSLPLEKKIVLMLQHIKRRDTKCWLIQPVNDSAVRGPDQDARIIVSDFVQDLIAWELKVYNASECQEDASGLQVLKDGNENCAHFYRTTHEFEIYPKEQMIHITLIYKNVSLDGGYPVVTVELWGGSCNLTCTTELSNCTVNKTPVEITMGRGQQLVSRGFYCFRIFTSSPHCVLYTDSKEMTEKPEEMKSSGMAEIIPLVAIGSLLLAVMIAVSVWVLKEKMRSRSSLLHSETIVRENLLSSTTPQIFLLYSRDSPQFCAAVKAFKTILEKNIIKVHDPLDESREDEILRNKEAWLVSLIEAPNVKIVFILSEGAIFRQKALVAKRNVVSSDPHCLDSIFIQALNHLLHNTRFIHDYQRIFCVRFEDTVVAEMSPALTPLSRFTLLRDLPQLLTEITGNHQVFIDNGDIPTPELENFRTKMEDLKSLHKENTNFLHSFVEMECK